MSAERKEQNNTGEKGVKGKAKEKQETEMQKKSTIIKYR